MQEQPQSEPSRREPAERARRRSPKATFTPPAVPSQAAEPASSPAADRPKPARRAKGAPAVLFRPPDPDADQPLPRQPVPARPTGGPDVSSATPTDAAPAGTGTAATEPAVPTEPPVPPGPADPPEQADPAEQNDPAEQALPAGAGTKPAKKAAAKAAKKAAPVRAATLARKPSTPVKAGTPAQSAAPAQSATPVGEATPVGKASPARKATTPRKASTAAPRRASRPATVVPVAAPADAPPVAVAAGAEATRVPSPRPDARAVAAGVLDHPGYAPELLALAAVDALGPGARAWAERLRATYPQASPDGLARLATRRFVRLAGAGGATAALAGVFAPVAELATVLWTQANLVLHLAAAYGRDPVHPDRAVELLVLTQVHPDEAGARTALDAARTADEPTEGPWPRAAEAAWRLATPLAAQAGGWFALRLASRLLPGAAALAAATGDAAAAERLAARAVAAYRPTRASWRGEWPQ
ncbi:hypothetical protein ACIBTV_25705 [Micromonospora sp. NPDC049366]|uniref:hypothetical protein n=1 Tax=Micromonospora sp. NPDC049366 TaxID=3364271 RepID=UPI0037B4DBA1